MNIFEIDKRLLIVLIATLLVKMAIAHFLPMTGDEAYFIVWGKHPDYGFYDHTPMVGWFLAALLSISDAPLWLRMPSILITTFIGWMIYLLLRRQHEAVAVAVAVLYLLAPVNVLGVLITTDTPLIFWSFLSAVFFYLAQRHDNLWWYLASGVLLGLAFFSKFFAGLLGIAYVLYVVFYVRRGLKPYYGLLLVVFGTLPFIGLNLQWNYHNCWNNYLFNLFNRTAGVNFSLGYTLKYLVLLVYLVTPPIVYYIVKQQAEFRRFMHDSRQSVFMGLFIIPIGLFLLLSFWKSIGLHWLFSFYPFLFIAIAPLFSTQQLRKCFYFMLPFSVLHVIFIAMLLILAPGIFKDYDENAYKDVVYGMRSNVILDKVSQYKKDYVLATDSYTESSLLSYHSRQHVIVFGPGSYHAREDDKLTDFRKLQGKNILLVSYSPELKHYGRFFKQIEIKPISVEQTRFYIMLGRGFNFQAYRDEVLDNIIERYYAIPDYLPYSSCYMEERYQRNNK